MQLNTTEALQLAYILKFFEWAKGGQFLYDSTQSFSFSLKGDIEAANAVAGKWEKIKVPSLYKDRIFSAKLQNYVLSRQWQKIIDETKKYQLDKSIPIGEFYFFLSRAYIEQGKIDEAAKCICSAPPPKTKTELTYLAISLFYLFCISGKNKEASEILESLNGLGYKFPKCVELFWLARAALENGDESHGLKLLNEAKAVASLEWRQRIEQFQPVSHYKVNKDLFEKLIEIRNELKNDSQAYAIIYSTQKPRVILLLIAVIITVFTISNLYFIIPSAFTSFLSITIFNGGMLIPELVKEGQIWRLLTFLFLHANFIHASVNCLALYLFGRVTIKIYGVFPFLLIYFLSGIFSGLCQAYFVPDLPCIGASGAIMGIFGAAFMGLFRLRHGLPQTIRANELRKLSILLIIQLISDQLIPHIGVSAHIGGLIIGALLASILPVSKTIKNKLNSY